MVFVCAAAMVTSFSVTTVHASFYTGGGIETGVNAAAAIAGVGPTTTSPETTIRNVISVFAGYVGTFALAVIVIAGMYLILGFGNDTSKETAKKIILYAAIGIAIVALADEIVALFEALPTGTDVTDASLALRPRIVTIINLIFTYVAMILLVVIFAAGIIMLTSGGDEGRKDSARKIIIYAIIGTAIIVFAKALANFIVTIFA